MMIFDVNLKFKERASGVTTEVDVRLEVLQERRDYKAHNRMTSPIIGHGHSPQAAILDFLSQQLHSVETLAFNQQDNDTTGDDR